MRSTSGRIPLNPCDYLIHGKHRALVRAAQGGNIAYMMIDAVGHASPDRVREALIRTMRAHPVTLARLRTARLTGKPYWKIPPDPDRAVMSALDQAYAHDDLRAASDWRQRLDRLCQDRYATDWNLAAGPLVRFEHYTLPDSRTRFCLRWPHCLMDAEGAQWFLSELGSHCLADDTANAPVGLPPELDADHRPVDVLAGRSLLERLALLRRGFSLQQAPGEKAVRSLIRDRRPPFTDHRALHRHFAGDRFQQIQENAKAETPPGPGRHARHLAGCVVRAVHTLYSDLGIHTDAYLITLPMRVTMPDRDGRAPRRPLQGNYLVSPVLRIPRCHASQRSALADDLLRQLQVYRAQDGDIVQWTMLWAASLLRASMQRLLLKLPLGFSDLASGFSYYGEINRPVSSISGTAVTNVYGGGPLPSPPGWNPVFSRFQDQLNLSLTWNRPVISDDLAHRYADLIEQELLATP